MLAAAYSDLPGSLRSERLIDQKGKLISGTVIKVHAGFDFDLLERVRPGNFQRGVTGKLLQSAIGI